MQPIAVDMTQPILVAVAVIKAATAEAARLRLLLEFGVWPAQRLAVCSPRLRQQEALPWTERRLGLSMI